MQLAQNSKKAQAKIMGYTTNSLESTDFKLREHVTYTMLGAVSLKVKLQNPKEQNQLNNRVGV